MMNPTMIFLTSFLLLLLLLQFFLDVKAGFLCIGSSISLNYQNNRASLFSNLSKEVTTNDGFYNTSLDGVHVLGLCRKVYDRQGCIDCIEKATQEIQTSCFNLVESFHWNHDNRYNVYCLVRTTNHSMYQTLALGPATDEPSPVDIDTSSTNMTLFRQEWEATVNRTLEAATINTSITTDLKYHGIVRAEFIEFQNVYKMMQCTPDINSGECKTCLQECVSYFKDMHWGKQGGEISRPSCIFRWDLYLFDAPMANLTRVPAPQGLIPPEREISVSLTRSKGGFIAIFVVPILINLLVFIGLIKAYSWMRKSNNRSNELHSDSNGQSKLQFDFGVILIATDNFSSENKLGEGGFGTVHKGTLPSGQEIAVKRLTKGSGQGDVEFRNEVLLLTRLQHRNLVKLLGFCNEVDEEILVYEYVPNSSLDHFIFDEEKRLGLTWDIRSRIIEGIARGLLYLHEDSQLRIIHRDLKASNILLDAEMNPKVADFGMAKLFNMDQTRGVTRRVVGTYGYMAPEYVKCGRFSVKTDVYSFGVMLLEMITGQSNRNYAQVFGLPAFTWKCWVEGQTASMIDHVLSKSSISEIMRFIHIGLLCVQENVTKRPTMSLVIQWLGSETIAIPLPTAAAFTTHYPAELHTSDASNQAEGEACTLSLNELSVTELNPR